MDAAGCTTCDCDNDTVNRGSGACVADGSADCDDLGPLVMPGASFVAAPWTSSHLPAGDWNCDGTVAKLYPSGVNCSVLAPCLEGNPGCGESAMRIECKTIGVRCERFVLGLAKQGCR